MGSQKIWGFVPAAGVGARMGANRPKQYLELAGRTVLACTLSRLCTHPKINGVMVGISDSDAYWRDMEVETPKLIGSSEGGVERANTVLNGLQSLSKLAQPGDWVLVHDAVRPCVRHSDIDRLIDAVSNDQVGGLLGRPVNDTIKSVSAEGEILKTVDRSTLWRALTPQMFRLQELEGAIHDAIEAEIAITDESSAIEWTGRLPKMIVGHMDNIKITVAEDLRLAELYLSRQKEGTG